MVKILEVYYHEKIVGQLIQDDHGEMSFTYSSHWLNNPEAIGISYSLPLQKEAFQRKACKAFFGGILPEESQRKLIAQNLGISANNDFSMLEKIGGECAGALSFIPAGEKLNPYNYDYQELSEIELPTILRELPTRPLLAGERNIRLSLAGVQEKLAVYIENHKIYLPLNNSPSTHIIKPDFSMYQGLIFNEAFCLKLAKQLGLAAVEADVQKIEDINYLLIRRYDRMINVNYPKEIKRLHQEDFCQALSILSTNKYQNEGGPSLKQCFDLLRLVSSLPVIDLEKMIHAIIFNYLIGNCDAHGKNFSLLYFDQLRLAPLYDLVCTLYYRDLSQKMAMKLGGEYHINKITAENFYKLADEIGFSKPGLKRVILELIDKTLISLSVIEIQNQVQKEVAELIKARCLNLARSMRKNQKPF